MEPVQSSLKKWMRQNENFKEHYDKVRNEVLNDPEIREFLSLHPELTNRDIEKNLIKFHEYRTQSKQCDRCKCYGDCINMVKGYSPILHVENGEVHLSYEKCHSRIDHEKRSDQEKLISSLYMPKDILNATLEGIDQGEGTRKDAIVQLSQFLAEAKEALPKKGLYFYGSFGIGKTFLLGAAANYLKELGYSSMLIYMPEFVREMKNSINDGTLNKKIDYFKQADVLMLDDIGAETQSAWFRDEILGSILQYRMMEGLPVFFTSNFSMEMLESQLAETRGKVEEVKALRIIERIKQVTKEVKVEGRNRRDG
ncbi:primosomal protein DnaI [Aciduricibacillus chroicocephali]|uniref:Primosomal protein DnaI n=1 Tax=Aciduricibacillus chroicocephali TaxID=3054939 RepID=A0ABY9KSJ4_9BACI|nr:primosomal protein DnaI [Bacillaceae bacterium 44XB]